MSLADNANQGIVPIKANLGNGQNPKNNLYWGALYGAKTHFKGLEDWSVKSLKNEKVEILDAFSLRHTAHKSSEISFEAWDGAKQKRAVKAYFTELRNAESQNDLVCFVGHNALMDLFVANVPAPSGIKNANLERCRKGSVIACRSASYFEPHHKGLGVDSYVMTKGLMAPEAYVLEGILSAWLNGHSAKKARAEAAAKYAEYQKIPLRNANWLFGVNT